MSAPSAHRRVWLSLGRLLLSRACFRFTRFARSREPQLSGDQVPRPIVATDVAVLLELSQSVDQALHADVQLAAKIVETTRPLGRPQSIEDPLGQRSLARLGLRQITQMQVGTGVLIGAQLEHDRFGRRRTAVLDRQGEPLLLAGQIQVRIRPGPEVAAAPQGEPTVPTAGRLAHVVDDEDRERLTAKADRSSNTIDIQAEGITRVTLYLNDVLVDLDRNVKVIVNGVEHEQRISRNFNTMMEQIYRGRSDPSRIYTASRDYDIPAPR